MERILLLLWMGLSVKYGLKDVYSFNKIHMPTKAIRDQVPAGSIRKLQSLTKIQKEWLEKRLRKADFGEKMRLHYYLGVILEDENEVQECFRIIQSEVLEATIKSLAYNEQARIVTDHHTVRLPLRVNWGGGWSDTPPYCNEKGGTVLNAAILLNGEKPVEVTLERIPEQKVVFDSRDMDVHGEFDTIEPLQATGDPYDPFALQKACLLACGIIPREGHTLGEILERLGSGFVMHSEVRNVPKGSGLGTSSILSAACVKAVFEFMGIAYTEEDLYAHVLAMEQIMSTGGGWQDQVGGITSGLKYITSMPGLQQQLQVAHIELSPQTKKELDERFVLIYTGQRRLARNLLRDVVGRYVGNEPDSLFALEEIQKTAALMRFELERGNVDGFAKLLDYHWELSKKIDDVVISASPEGILVSDKEQSSYIKPFVDKFEQQIMFAEKSWGSFKVVDVENTSLTIKVTLNPGHSMNYHSHRNRDEVWVVISGEGKTIVDGMEQMVKPGDVITMSAGCRHTVIADTELKLIEVQLGADINVHDKQKFELEQ